MPGSQHSPPLVAHEPQTAEKKVGANTHYILRHGITIAVATHSETSRDETGESATENEEAPENPTGDLHSSRESAPSTSHIEASDRADAARWQRLPRHIQLLATIDDRAQEGSAQRYYSREFKETRDQLIARLLDPTLTLEDAARVLGVVPATVRRYTNRGILTHHRTVGHQRRFRLSDVLAFLEFQQNKIKDFLDDTAEGSERGTVADHAG